ncbi:hypothetical protein EVAR_67941_1 [Eumeta japonica]|uniref:Uncharacterized protein n=1 Tax=Eumeta variegata TaxID=151549 RepID=A0A4C2A418_EUMVA|nr:hypothetical protein EVAR_67941_1 [Eumeta japonica]
MKNETPIEIDIDRQEEKDEEMNFTASHLQERAEQSLLELANRESRYNTVDGAAPLVGAGLTGAPAVTAAPSQPYSRTGAINRLLLFTACHLWLDYMNTTDNGRQQPHCTGLAWKTRIRGGQSQINKLWEGAPQQ